MDEWPLRSPADRGTGKGTLLVASWKRDVKKTIARCVACAAVKAARRARGARMKVYHPGRRFQQVAVDIQTITPRTQAGNIKVLVMIDTFTRFARAVPIPDERAVTVARKILDEWVSIFGAMETLLSDRGPNFIGTVVSSMAEQLGTKRVTTSPFHAQASGCVERWNRTLAQDLACFVCTGQEDWDQHVSLACLRYNTGVHEATNVSPFEAMFGIEAFMAWGEVEADRVMGEPYSTPKYLKELHAKLLTQGMRARRQASDQYNRTVKELNQSAGDRVLVWAPDLVSKEGSKVVPPWLGPYVVERELSGASYSLRSELSNVTARVHANRIRRISKAVVQTADPKEGVLPDGLRLLKKRTNVEDRPCPQIGRPVRWFNVQLRGRASPRWTAETELPEAIVRLYD